MATRRPGEAREIVRILLTNDDGIGSDGLWAAARGLARVGHLTVMGTADDWSNGSASIRHIFGAHFTRYEEIPDDLGSNVEAYSIESSPGGAVIAGLLTGLFEPFDLVVSGANYGINIGGDLVYSGTFGAAVVGYQRGVTSFAISSERGVNRGEEQRWDGIADVTERIAAWMLNRTGPPLLLNVNVPNRAFHEIAGARLVQPAPWANLDRARFTAEPVEEGGWRISTSFDRTFPTADGPDTDFAAVMAGEIAVCHLVPVGRLPEPPPADISDLLNVLTPGSPVPTFI